MTSRDGLMTEVRQMLSQLAATAPALTDRVAVDKIYELFVMSCLVRALQSIGATVAVRDGRDQPSHELSFRLGPGKIYHPSSAPGFILVSYRGEQYEIQNGLRVLGRSQVLHELDVCLIDRNEAHQCRQQGREPRQARIKFLAECKYYGHSLSLGLGREYLGLSTEFSLRVKTIVSNVGSSAVQQLVTKHRGTANFDIAPDDPQNVERFVQWLANELMQVL